MRIAYILYSAGVFGGVRIVAEHLNRLTDLGHECWLFTVQDTPLTWLPTRFNWSRLDAAPPIIGQCDVVVATSGDTWPLVARDTRFGKARRSVLIQMIEHLFYPPESEDYKALLPNLKLLGQPLHPIVISKWLKDEAENLSKKPVSLIRNGIDRELFYPDPFPESNPRPIRLLVEGNSGNQAKDVDEMAHFAIETLRVQGWKFDVWGFSQSAPRWAFDRYWVLPDQETIRHIYSSCDILVKATRYEGRPGPDLEAMACGCAVNRAILKGGDDLHNLVNCLVVDYGDLAGLTHNLQRLIVNTDLRQAMIEGGRNYVRDCCDWNAIMPDIEQALKE